MFAQWIPAIGAMCTLTGAVVGALVTWLVSRERRSVDERIANMGFVHSRDIETYKAALKAESDRYSAELLLKHEAQKSTQAIWDKINEQNWNVIIEKLRSLSKCSLDVTRLLKELALDCGDIDDDKFFSRLYAPLKEHADLGTMIADLENEIRPDDFPIFKGLHTYCVKIFLDFDMQQTERKSRGELYENHASHLSEIEVNLVKIRTKFVRALGLYPKI